METLRASFSLFPMIVVLARQGIGIVSHQKATPDHAIHHMNNRHLIRRKKLLPEPT